VPRPWALAFMLDQRVRRWTSQCNVFPLDWGVAQLPVETGIVCKPAALRTAIVDVMAHRELREVALGTVARQLFTKFGGRTHLYPTIGWHVPWALYNWPRTLRIACIGHTIIVHTGAQYSVRIQGRRWRGVGRGVGRRAKHEKLRNATRNGKPSSVKFRRRRVASRLACLASRRSCAFRFIRLYLVNRVVALVHRLNREKLLSSERPFGFAAALRLTLRFGYPCT
jgi:hypothetical protein